MRKGKRIKRSQSKVKRWAMLIVAVLLIGSTVVTCWFGFNNSVFETTFYQVRSEKVSSNIRIVQLSDLHLNQFGENNQQLVERIRSLDPDLIAITGDMTISQNPSIQPVVDLCRTLVEIAPVYYSWGNHEHGDIFNGFNTALPRELEAAGVTIVDYTTESLTIDGNDLVIGGLCASSDTILRDGADYLEEFCAREEFKLFLCHYPDVFEEAMMDYPVDLALCGHAHGGLIKLPGIGALYDNEQGFFPKLTQGCSQQCGSTVVISRGLGNSARIPRFNNRPELVVVDIDSY